MKPAFVLCAAVLVGAVGCTTEPAPLTPEAHPYLEQGRIQFESSTTKHVIQIVRVDTQRVTGGLLKVVVTMRNLTKKNLWADVRTTFLDADRHVLEQTNWEPTLLDSRTVSEYTCTSLSDRAADYQVLIRKPKKTELDMP